MNAELRQELEAAINSGQPMEEVVKVLRRCKDRGVAQAEVYSYLETLHQSAGDEATDDRILEAADFVAGFCSPHMKVWDATLDKKPA